MPDPQPDPAHEPPHSIPDDPELPHVQQHVDTAQLKHFVTVLKSTELQVGEHIVQALHDDETVAVLTTVMMGPDGQQRLVSAGLGPRLMHEIQRMLGEAQQERTERIPCVGFHCWLDRKADDGGDGDDAAAPTS